jgi:protein required for attachment to host cells
LKLTNDALILVADGSRMFVLHNQGDEVFPDLRVLEHHAAPNPPNREILADAPGVSTTRGHHGRDTMERGDPHRQNEVKFLIQAAEVLSAQARRNPRAHLIIVAPPIALGELRHHLDEATRGRIVAEFDKDLTKHPVEDIARLLSGY